MNRINFTNANIFKDNIKIESKNCDGTPESLFWDFKAKIDNSKACEIAKDICAFANTMGGTLLIGVSESLNSNELKIAKGYRNIENAEKLKQFIHDVVLPKITPIPNVSICVFRVDGNVVMAINIEPYIRSLGCVNIDINGQGYAYLYRTEYGNSYYSPLDVEKKMSLIKSRQHEIFLKEKVPLNTEIEFISPIFAKSNTKELSIINNKVTCYIREYYDWGFMISVNSRTLNIPYDAIKKVWTNIRGNASFELDLFMIVPKNPEAMLCLISRAIIQNNSEMLV